MKNNPNSSSCVGERGIVLPVVLVMLLLMTVTVLFLMRRGTVDELLASNVRQVTTLDTAAQFALRSCERWLWVSTPGFAPRPGDPDPPEVVVAPAAASTAAWRDNANWTNRAVSPLPAADLGDGIAAVNCLIEDASSELELITNYTQGTSTSLTNEPNWRKYRVTAEVQGTGNTVARSQVEVRMRVPAS